MISKVLQCLIEKYNEKGMFVALKNKIVWFNGKRFETWLDKNTEKINMIRVIKGKLISYANCSFFEITCKLIKRIGVTANYFNTKCILNNFIYYVSYGDIEKVNRYTKASKTIILDHCCQELFVYKNAIYSFGFYNIFKIDENEIVTTCRIPPYQDSNLLQICLYGNKFYCYDYDFYYIYEPDVNIWSHPICTTTIA